MLHIPSLPQNKHKTSNHPETQTTTPGYVNHMINMYADPNGNRYAAETHHLRYLPIKTKRGLFSRPTHHMYEFDSHYHTKTTDVRGPGDAILPGSTSAGAYGSTIPKSTNVLERPHAHKHNPDPEITPRDMYGASERNTLMSHNYQGHSSSASASGQQQQREFV